MKLLLPLTLLALTSTPALAGTYFTYGSSIIQACSNDKEQQLAEAEAYARAFAECNRVHTQVVKIIETTVLDRFGGGCWIGGERGIVIKVEYDCVYKEE